MKTIKINKNLLTTFLGVLLIFGFSMWTRSGTLYVKTILDYDPWYFYRLSEGILKNNMKVPEWDLFTFFPPGRPHDRNMGWEYTMIFFYKFFSVFKPSVTFMEVAKVSPMIMVGLTSIAAFLLGNLLTNKWGGFATGLFAAATPTFIGVSMAGYCDTDVVVAFYTFICIFSIFLAVRKKKIPYFILAVALNLIAIYNWFFAWYVSFFFLLFVPIFILYTTLENLIFYGKINVKKTWEEVQPTVVPIIIFLVAISIMALIFRLGSIIDFLRIGLGFTGKGGSLVNVSVAELQPINILTKEGFLSVAGRVGKGPLILFLFGLPSFVVYKLIKKEKVSPVEIFLFMWSGATFYLILSGVRFSLLFSCAASAGAGYVIGNLVKLLKRDIFGITVFSIIILFVIMFISDAIVYANQASGMEVGQNWIDMLEWLKKNADQKAIVATWWDPGHIIAGYAGLRVHADGAHCAVGVCIPWPHDTRIQDMGRIMTTSNETEAVALLKKYMALSEEDCQKVKEKYGDIVPKEACEPASEMYFIASSDLIGKYTWMNYFGGYRAPITSPQDFERNPGVCCPSTPLAEPGQLPCGEFADKGRGVWVWCPWVFNFDKQQQDQQGNPVYLYDYGGIKMAILQKGNELIPIYNNRYVITNMVFFSNGQEQRISLTNTSVNLSKINGMVWIDPSFRTLIYFSPEIKNSMFTRLFFFNGEGLQHFKLVFSNGEIRMYKMDFGKLS